MSLYLSLVLYWILTRLHTMQHERADKDGMRTVEQMQRTGFQKGLPLEWHLGIWGDKYLITPLVCAMLVLYGYQWSLLSWAEGLALALLVTIPFHIFVQGKARAEAHGRVLFPTDYANMSEKPVTRPAGWPHTYYMLISLTVAFTFYLGSHDVPHKFLIAAALCICLHFFLAAHMVLGFLAGYADGFEWVEKNHLRDGYGWSVILVVWAIAFYATHYRWYH